MARLDDVQGCFDGDLTVICDSCYESANDVEFPKRVRGCLRILAWGDDILSRGEALISPLAHFKHQRKHRGGHSDLYSYSRK